MNRKDYLQMIQGDQIQKLKTQFEQFSMMSNTDERYGQMIIFRNNQDPEDLIFVQEQVFLDQNNLKQRLNVIEKRRNLTHPNLQNIYQCSKIDTSTLCSTTSKLQIVGEYIFNNLNNEIIENKKMDQFIEEKDMMNIIQQLVGVLLYLQKRGIFHGNINSNQISISNDGSVKIIDSLLLNDMRSNYFLLNPKIKSNIYLAPEQFNINRTVKFNELDMFKIDVFCLGLTFIYVLTNQDPQECFDMEQKTINIPQLETLLNQISINYSVKL